MVHLPGAASMIAALASLVLALIVYQRTPDRALGRVFGFLASTLVFWNLNFAVLYSIRTYSTAFVLSWVFRTGAVFLLPAILHLCLVLPGRPLSQTWRTALALDYALASALAGLNIAGLLVTRLATFEWGYYSIGSTYYNFFPVLVILNFSVSLFVLIYEYVTTTEPRMRLQLKFWLLGMMVALPLGLTNLLPSYGIPFYPLGNLGSAAWATIVAYAIVRYRLMDIELVVTRALGFLSTLLVVVAPVLVSALLLQRMAFGEVHYDFSAVLALLLTLVGITFSGSRLAIESRLERALFPAKVASRSRLAALGGEVVQILDRERLLDLLADSIFDAFMLERLALYARSPVHARFELVRSMGAPPRQLEIPQDSPIIRWLRGVGEAVVREEARAGGRRSGGGEVEALLEGSGWEVCVPFIGGADLLGFIALGSKRGLQAFSAGDLDLLSRVASEASIALQNARLYEEVRRSREIINRAGRLSAIGTLAAGIAHEIRNPLVSIQTFFQLAPGRLEDEEFMTSFLRLAENEVQRIGDLITELLTFAKSPSTTVREIEINEIVERAITLLVPQANANRIELILRLGSGLGSVLGDGDRLMQVCLNLCINALQATAEHGQVIVETREALRDGEKYCELSVTDSGEGIPEAIRESIFDPFFTTKDKGSGLGLAICHQIVLEAGGFMIVDSAEGRGSTFRVVIPTVNARQGCSGGGRG